MKEYNIAEFVAKMEARKEVLEDIKNRYECSVSFIEENGTPELMEESRWRKEAVAAAKFKLEEFRKLAEKVANEK